MIRAVLDANVLVAGFPASRGTLAELLDLWRQDQFRIVTSEHILEEIRRAWAKPYWAARFSSGDVEQAVRLLRQGEVTPLTAEVLGIATHEEDNFVLATAVSAQVDYLITGDKELQDLRHYGSVTIVSPSEFFGLLAQHIAE